MKKILAIVVALMMVFSMSALAETAPKIGILAPVTTHAWVSGVAFHAQNTADELFGEGNYIMVTAAEADEYSANIDMMIQQGVESLVLWTQFDGIEVATERALEAGIKIFNFDMIVNVDEKYADSMYVLTGDNYGMGVAGAEYIVSKIGTEGTVLIIDVPSSGNVAADRKAGFLETMAMIAPDVEFVEIASDSFSRQEGLDDMAAALMANPQIDAVFSMDDETSMGALQAIVEAGRTDVKAITGGGGCQEYFAMMTDEKYADIWVASATYSPNMIITCIENAVKVMNGEEVENYIVHPTSVVDRENVADFINPDSPY